MSMNDDTSGSKVDRLASADDPGDERLLHAIGRAVRSARGDMNQTELARRVIGDPAGQSAISKIERGIRDLPINLWEMAHIEIAAGRPPGFILEELGYLRRGGLNLRQSIAAHAELSSEGRAIVLAALEAAEAVSRR